MAKPSFTWLSAIVFLSFSFTAAGCGNSENHDPPLFVKPSGRVEKKAGLEISGLVKSRRHNNVYWAVNDSGNPAAIIPLNIEGNIVSLSGKGITVTGAQNIDWEALAVDSAGKLYIFDTGNNYSLRKELQIYAVREPGLECETSEKAEIIKVRYPGQAKSSPDKFIYDCEAAFFFRGKLYLLTKRLQDAATSLYRLDRKKQNIVTTLTHLKTYPIGGYVTSADMSADEETLAVLTYRSLWLFYDFPDDDFFSGKKKKIPLKGAGQVESVVFSDKEELLLVNETRNEIFKVALPLR